MFIALGTVITLVILGVPRYRANLLYFVAPMNAIADAATLGDENSVAGLMRLPVLIAALAVYSPRIKIDAVNSLIAFFLVYLAVLVPFSSDPLGSVRVYTKVLLCLSMLPVASYVVINAVEMSKLRISIVFTAVIYLINFLCAQVFELGNQQYGENAFHVAGGGVFVSYTLTYALILGPMTLMHSKRPQRLLLGFVYALSAIVVLITFRRGAIAALLAGYLVLIASRKPRHAKPIFTMAAMACLVLVFVVPMHSERLLGLYEQRFAEGVTGEFDESEQGRVKETIVVWKELFGKSWKHTLVGTELFNSVSYFHSWRSGKGRSLHIDMNVLLHGSGIIGLFLYLAILGQIVAHFLMYSAHQVITAGIDVSLYRSTAWALILAALILSISGQLYAVTAYSCFWMLIGALYRLTSHAPSEIPALGGHTRQHELIVSGAG